MYGRGTIEASPRTVLDLALRAATGAYYAPSRVLARVLELRCAGVLSSTTLGSCRPAQVRRGAGVLSGTPPSAAIERGNLRSTVQPTAPARLTLTFAGLTHSGSG